MADKKKTDQGKMRPVRYDVFNQEEEEIEWLVDELLPNVGWTLFVGREGSGKSTFALQLCGALQSGLPFLGRETIATETLYIQADSPSIEWREMTRKIVPLSSGVTIVNVPVKCLSNETYVRQLDTFINTNIKPGFIVWDSLYNLTGSSINSESALEPIQTMKLLSANKPWLLIHHPPNEEMRAAGHHSISANCSRVWYLQKAELKVHKGRLSKLKGIKMQRDENTELGLWVCSDIEKRDKTFEERCPILSERFSG